MKAPSFREYLGKLMHHASVIFSVISLLLAAVLPFLSDSSLGALLGSFLVAISFSVSGYFVWKEEVEKHPTNARLEIQCESTELDSDNWKITGAEYPFRLLVYLSLTNRGGSKAILNRVGLMPGASFQGEIAQGVFIEDPKGSEQRHLSLPIHLAASDWKDVNYVIPFRPDGFSTNSESLARLLCKLERFEFQLTFTYRNPDDEQVIHVLVQGSFTNFKQGIIDQWKRESNWDLVMLARCGEA
jgi:hypothetical protein